LKSINLDFLIILTIFAAIYIFLIFTPFSIMNLYMILLATQ